MEKTIFPNKRNLPTLHFATSVRKQSTSSDLVHFAFSQYEPSHPRLPQRAFPSGTGSRRSPAWPSLAAGPGPGRRRPRSPAAAGTAAGAGAAGTAPARRGAGAAAAGCSKAAGPAGSNRSRPAVRTEAASVDETSKTRDKVKMCNSGPSNTVSMWQRGGAG